MEEWQLVGDDTSFSRILSAQFHVTFIRRYSRVPNKRGVGLEMVRYSNNRGVGIIGGGGFLEK